LEWLREKRAEILDVAARHGAAKVRVFGSVAREQDSRESDIDFLVAVGPETSSWFPAGLILDLESLLSRRVEVVTEAGLDPLLRQSVFHEAVPL
jgi:hypothetical protein